MWAGSPTSRRGACASSATRRRASPKTICASCGSSASTPPMARALRPAGPRRLHRRARRPRAIVARARAHGGVQAARCQARGADARSDDGHRIARAGARRRTAARELRQHDQARGRACARLGPVRRLGALTVSVVEDAERLRERLRLANAECERLASMADGWWQIAGDWEERDGRALLYRLGSERFTDRVLLAWSRSPQGAEDRPWHRLAMLPVRWSAPAFPLKAADFMARGVPKGPRLGAALAAAEEAWIAAGFPQDAAAVAAIADAAAAATR